MASSMDCFIFDSCLRRYNRGYRSVSYIKHFCSQVFPPGHHVQVVQVMAVRCHHRVLAVRHHDHVVVLYGAGVVQAAVVGVDALEGKALRWVQSVVVGSFQQGFHRGLFQVVLMRWTS